VAGFVTAKEERYGVSTMVGVVYHDASTLSRYLTAILYLIRKLGKEGYSIKDTICDI